MTTSSPGTCQIDVQKKNGGVLLTVSGQITENSGFATMSPDSAFAGAKNLMIDLAKVDRINSNGVRGWLIFIEKVQAKTAITFTAVSEAIIEQAMMTPNILGPAGTPIQSFDVPYTCPKCSHRWTQAISTQSVNLKAPSFKAPKAQCPKCQTTGQFDAMEDEYFTFIKRSAE